MNRIIPIEIYPPRRIRRGRAFWGTSGAAPMRDMWTAAPAAARQIAPTPVIRDAAARGGAAPFEPGSPIMARSKAKSRPKTRIAKAAARKAAPKRAAKTRTAPRRRARKGIPAGFATITAHLVVEGAADAMDFYKRAFAAQEIARAPMPDGKRLMHGLMKVGDSMLMLVDAFEEFGAKGPKALGGSAVTLHLYVPDADAAFQRALDAGCSVAMPLADMFWGDRYGKVKDPFGHEWSIATKLRDLSPAELAAAQKAAFGEAPKA